MWTYTPRGSHGTRGTKSRNPYRAPDTQRTKLCDNKPPRHHELILLNKPHRESVHLAAELRFYSLRPHASDLDPEYQEKFGGQNSQLSDSELGPRSIQPKCPKHATKIAEGLAN